MWLRNIPFFQDIFHDLVRYVLFNTLQEYPDGITLYDLKKIGNIPHSKLYRMMKKQEEKKLFVTKIEQNELGRPKHIYFLTDEGRIMHNDLKLKLIDNLTKLKEISHQDNSFDANTFLDQISLTMWKNPIDQILDGHKSDEEKLHKLQCFEEQTFKHLTQIRENITQIQNKIKNKEKNV